MHDDNPYAPPQARVEDIAPVDGERELAGRGPRLGAVLIDTGILMLVNLPLLHLLDGFKPDPSAFELVRNALAGMLVFVALDGVLLARHGQTIGKRLLDVHIVRGNGARAGIGRLLGLRYGLFWVLAVIPVLGFVVALVDSLLIFRESHKCLHDDVADTIVIKA